MHDRDCAAQTRGRPDGHLVAIVISFGYPESEESRHRGVAIFRILLNDAEAAALCV